MRETSAAALDGECRRVLSYINCHISRKCNLRSSSFKPLKEIPESSNSFIMCARAQMKLPKSDVVVVVVVEVVVEVVAMVMLVGLARTRLFQLRSVLLLRRG